MNILFVDDEPNILRGLRRTLRANRNRWSMYFAEGAREALKVLDDQRVDVLVTDMRMPGLSGKDLAIRLKERHPEVLCIGLTGYCKPKENLDSPSLFHQFWSKPARQDFMVSHLERIEESAENMEPEHRRWLSGLRNLPADLTVRQKLVKELNAVCPDYAELKELTKGDIGLHAKLVQIGSTSFCGPVADERHCDVSALLRDEIGRQLFSQEGLFALQNTSELQALSQNSRRCSQRAQALAESAGAPGWVVECASAGAHLAGLSELVCLPEESPFCPTDKSSCHKACRFLLAVWGVNPRLCQAVEGALKPNEELSDGSRPEHFTSLAALSLDPGNRRPFVDSQLRVWGIERPWKD